MPLIDGPHAADVAPHIHELPPVTVDGQQVTLFAESPPMLAALLADVGAARRRVWIESYIFADDEAGRAVLAALAERARAGVDVRLMVDGFGSFSTPDALFEPLRAAGGGVHFFQTLGQVLRGPRLRHALNQRNHRKLMIVDDAIAYFGGMNVVDQSGLHTRADAKARRLPATAGWRDVHARIAGPRQAEIAAMMDRLWRRVHGERALRGPRWQVPDLARLEQDAMWFFGSRPTFKDRRPQRVLVPLVRQAQREITLSMAYFVPPWRLLRELVRARRRGVRVSVIVPGASDVPLVQWACRHSYESLLQRGIRIYERRDRMLHSKAMVIDRRYSLIGSCNFDARSLLKNLEFFSVIHSRPLAERLSALCLEEIRASVRIDAEYCRRRACWQRRLDRLAWGFRRWL